MQQHLFTTLRNNNRRFLHRFSLFSTAKVTIFLYLSVNLPKNHVSYMIISYFCNSINHYN